MSVSIPSQGTHFSDGVRTGPFLASQYTAGANVLTPSTLNYSPVDTQPPGIYNTPQALLNITPYAVAAANLAASQSPGAAGYLTLVTTSGPGVTVKANVGGVTGPNGGSVLVLDVPRNVSITSGGNDTSIHFTVFGWDEYNEPMVEQITGSNSVTAFGKKAFKIVQAIYISAASASTVTAGVGNAFGFQYLLDDANYAFQPMWNGLPDFLFPVYAAQPIVALGAGPLTTTMSTGTILVTVASTTGLVVGETVAMRGLADSDDIPAADLNIDAQITAVVTNTSFSYTAGGGATATSGGSGEGGSSGTYQVLTPPALTATGTVTIGVQAPATITTGDVRGTYTPSTAANGAQRLTINYYQPSADGRVYNGASNSASLILNSGPISTTSSSGVVQILAPNHQLTTGELVTISGAATTNAVTAAQLNLTNVSITVVDENNFTYATAGTANATASGGGGSAVTMSPSRGNLFQVPQGRFGVTQYTRALF